MINIFSPLPITTEGVYPFLSPGWQRRGGVNYLAINMILFALLVASLSSAKALQRQQEQRLLNFYRVSVLDKRSRRIRSVIDSLESMQAPGDALAVLYECLYEDLQQIQALEPARNLKQALSSAQSATRRKPESGGARIGLGEPGRSAFASQQELMKARTVIRNAVQLCETLHRAKRLSVQRLQDLRVSLWNLSVHVGVNSCMLMARQALENTDPDWALNCYHQAENLLNGSRLEASEKAEKLRLVQTEQQRLFKARQQEDRQRVLAATMAKAQ